MSEYNNVLRISGNIYGRERELDVLREAYRWSSLGSTELVLVTGHPGVGKSSLVRAFKSSVSGKCRFAGGKFDPYHAGVPYEVFTKCFQHVIRQLLTESEPVLQKWTERFREAVGSNGSLITSVIPEARLLLGPSDPGEPLPSAAGKHRFERVFRRFVQVFAGADGPLVLFLDDLQWADEASLELLHSLIVDPDSQHLLVIGTCREPETGEAVRFLRQWLDKEHAGYSLRELPLQPLPFAELQNMVADALQCAPGDCFPLAHVLYVKSVGNPLHAGQLLQTAVRERLVRFAEGRWEWNMNGLDRLPAIDGQLELLTGRLHGVPPQTKEALVLGACLGSSFTPRLLSALGGGDELSLAESLDRLVREGLLLKETPHKEPQYRFTHDRIRQAAYSMPDGRRREEIHLAAARRASQTERGDEREPDALFDTVNHFNQALGLLGEEELAEVAKLNERAGTKALQASAYSLALHYFKTAVGCMNGACWETQYDFALRLHLSLAECEYLCGHSAHADALLDAVLAHARSWADRAQAYKLKIEQYSNAGKYAQSIRLGIEALREAGIRLTESPGRFTVVKDMLLAKQRLDRRLDELAGLPPISDPQARATLELLVALVAPTFFSNRGAFAVVVSKFIRLVFRYGTSPAAPVIYASYGMLLGTVLGHYRKGYRLGQLAVRLADSSGDPSVKTKVHVMFYGVISPWVRYEKEDERKLEQAAKLGIEAGDYVYASYAVGSLINLAYVRCPVEEMLRINRRNLQLIEQTKEELVLKNALVYIDMAKKWGTPAADVFTVTDGRESEREFLDEVAQDESKSVTLYQIYTYKTQIHYLFGRYREAVRYAEEAEPYEGLAVHSPHYPEHHLYEALAIAAAWDRFSAAERRTYAARLRRRHKQFKRWERMSPDNFRHKLLLLEAETARIRGREEKLIGLYDQAIDCSRERGYFRYEAIACERAARHHALKGRERVARGYLEEADDAYGQWGLTSKRHELRKEFPGWLPDLPEPGRFGAKSAANGAPPAEHAGAAAGLSGLPGEGSGGSRPGGPETAAANGGREVPTGETDLAAILKASLSLTQGVDLRDVMGRLMNVILESAGVDKGCLIAAKGGSLSVEGVMRQGGGMTCGPVPLEDSPDVPVSLVQYASRLEEAVMLQDTAEDELFRRDPYMIRRECRSVCCLPLFARERLYGLLYMESEQPCRLPAGERLETIRMIAAQALFVWRLAGSFDTAAAADDPTSGREPKTGAEKQVDSLTDRESEVLNLMATGLTNKEIAYRLGVTAGTVKVHMHHIFSKLNVNRRTKAIAEAKRKNLLE